MSEGLSKYLPKDDKTGDRLTEGRGLARYLPEARSAGSEDTDEK